MGLEIIIGPKSKDKNIYLYKKIKQDVDRIGDVLFFVPSQKRVIAENEYMQYLNLEGIINLKITTLSEYIKKIINTLNIHYNDEYLTSLDENILVSKIIDNNKNELKRYGKVLNKEGFILEVSNYISTLRRLDVQENEILKIKKNKKIEVTTKEKLEELLLLYSSYISEIGKNGFVDDNSYVKIYSKLNDRFPQKIYFDGYNNFTNIEYEIIEMFIKNGIDVVISLVTDAKKIEDINTKNTSEIFEIPNVTYTKLIKIASKYNIAVYENYIKYGDEKEKDLAILGEYAFSDIVNVNGVRTENIKINLVKNEKAEIISIADSIIENVHNGLKYSDNIIYTSNIDKYENIVRQVFYEYNIPFYLDKKESMENNVLVKYILLLRDVLINPYDAKLLISILKLRLNDVDNNELAIFENYITEFNIYDIRNKFTKKTKNFDYDLASLNIFREKIIRIFENDMLLNKEFTENYVTFFVERIYKHIINNNVLKNYENYINSIQDLYAKEVLVQVTQKLSDMFDSINKIYKKISYKKFCEVFNNCVKQIKIDTIPSSINQVNILDINSSKSTQKKCVYIVGANEGELPIDPQEDIIFSDGELEKLEEINLKVKENVSTKYNMGLYNIYEAFNTVKNKLYIYIKSSDMSSKSLSASRIIERLKEMFDIDVCENVINDIRVNYLTKADILQNIKFVSDKEELAIFDILKYDSNFSKSLMWKKDDKNLKKDTLDKIYGDKILSSVTKLESFKKCPFSYYLKYILNIKNQEKFELTSLDLGTFMHSVIEEFSNYILLKNITWNSLVIKDEFLNVEQELDNIISSNIDKILEKQKESFKFNILKQKLINTIKSIIKIIAKSFNQSEFIPYGYEIEFRDGAMFAPITLNIGDRTVELIGKIDRVDTLNIDDKMYVRVVDYKSSNKTLKLDDIREGISLQLITYLSNFIKNVKNKSKLDVIPAAMTYFTISEKMLNLDSYLSEDEIKENIISSLRLKGIFISDLEILNKMDKKFESKERLIDISKMSIARKTDKCLEESDYQKLCSEANNILSKIAKEILDGVVKISPNRKIDSCSYCEYGPICRKNIAL